MEDLVNHPSHYIKNGLECFDVIVKSQGVVSAMDYCICASQKYIFRHKNKGDAVKDISKAKKYLENWLILCENCTDEEWERYLA